MSAPSDGQPGGPHGASRPVLITGGAGFIGSNLADRLLVEGHEIIVLDNLSRPGVEANLAWLEGRHGARIRSLIGDLRDGGQVAEAVRGARAVFHFAAQVAVTTSLADPREDFDVNASGTLTLLEAVRRAASDVPVVYSSTNKVYGGLADVAVTPFPDRYQPSDDGIRAHGIGEARPLDFHTPYGCSKGVADQYVLDYSRSFGLKTAVLRMSCIYGPRQFGTEDQGWVAHFLIRALRGETITIYGDGRQVRDILHVADAVDAYVAVLDRIDAVSGRAFNLGGGPRNAVSLLMLLREIERLAGRPCRVAFSDWRTGDQLYFVADTRKLEDAVGWRARIGWREGVAHLAEWLDANRGLVKIPSGKPAAAKAGERVRA